MNTVNLTTMKIVHISPSPRIQFKELNIEFDEKDSFIIMKGLLLDLNPIYKNNLFLNVNLCRFSLSLT